MRFYFQDAEDKVTTKCIRVASTANTLDVIRVLMEKLRPDMKTLPNEKDFCIYEVHPNGGERTNRTNFDVHRRRFRRKKTRNGRTTVVGATLLGQRSARRSIRLAKCEITEGK